MAIKRIGVLTGGGDAPGLNPAIRAVVRKACALGWEVYGLYDGWRGLLDGADGSAPEVWPLDPELVAAWDADGGTHLGSSRTNPFNHKKAVGDPRIDASAEVMTNVARLSLDALVPIGGEDTLGVALRLHKLGVPVVGIPKTIDKDLGGTDYTLGFDTSMRTCADIIERSATPAGSHHWVQVVEVMGRHAGHLALWSGLAGGAFMTLIPEAPFQIEQALALLDARLSMGKRDRRYPRYAVVVVAEGAIPAGQKEITIEAQVDAFGHAASGWAASGPGSLTRFASARSGIRARWRSATRSAAVCRRRSIASWVTCSAPRPSRRWRAARSASWSPPRASRPPCASRCSPSSWWAPVCASSTSRATTTWPPIRRVSACSCKLAVDGDSA